MRHVDDVLPYLNEILASVEEIKDAVREILSHYNSNRSGEDSSHDSNIEFIDKPVQELTGILEGGRKTMTLFITANDNERVVFLAKLKNQTTKTYSEGVVCKIGDFGKYKSTHYHTPRQGNDAELEILRAVEAVNPSYVILVGVACGGNDDKQKIGDVLVSRNVIDYDCRKEDYNLETKVEATIWRGVRTPSGDLLYRLFNGHYFDWQTQNNLKVHLGDIISSSELLNSPIKKDRVFATFNDEPVGYEMEGMGAFRACRYAKIAEWLLVKGICDFGDGNKAQNKQKNQECAAKNAVSLCHYIFSQDDIFPSRNNHTTENAVIVTLTRSLQPSDFFQEHNDKMEYDIDKMYFEKLFVRSTSLYEDYMKHQRFYMNRLIDESILPELIVTFRNESGKSLNTHDFIEYLNNEMLSIVQIIGEGGTGKTTSLLRVWELCCQQKIFIAFYIPLHEINNCFSSNEALANAIESNWICDLVYERYFRALNINYNLMVKMLSVSFDNKRKFVFLLDGFNEISQTNKQRIVNHIKSLKSSFLNASIILTTRYNLDNDFSGITFTPIHLAPLLNGQIENYLSDKGVAFADNSSKLRELLKNPMMLTVYCSACEILNNCPNNAPFLFRIPFNTKGELIANHIESLLLKHWATFQLDEREFSLLWERWIFNFILTKIAFEMSVNEKITISDAELWKIIVEVRVVAEKRRVWLEDWFFKYGHRNFPELLDNTLFDKGKIKKSCDIQNYLETQYSLFLIDDSKKKTWRFWHQDYRDCLAATHILNELMYSEYNGDLPEILNHHYSNDVLRFMGELQLYSEGGE